MKNFYSVLGVAQDAEVEVIAAAYKALMRKYHPDTNASPGAAGKAQQINEAYDTLRDPLKRSAHDRALDMARRPKASPPPPPPPPPRRSEPPKAAAARKSEPKSSPPVVSGPTQAGVLLSFLAIVAIIYGYETDRDARVDASRDMPLAADIRNESDPLMTAVEADEDTNASASLERKRANTALSDALAANRMDPLSLQSPISDDEFDLGAMSPAYDQKPAKPDPFTPSRDQIETEIAFATAVVADTYAKQGMPALELMSEECLAKAQNGDILEVDYCVAFHRAVALIPASDAKRNSAYWTLPAAIHLSSSYSRFGLDPTPRRTFIRERVRAEFPSKLEGSLEAAHYRWPDREIVAQP